MHPRARHVELNTPGVPVFYFVTLVCLCSTLLRWCTCIQLCYAGADGIVCGAQLGEEVKFEQLSEKWTCKAQHVRLQQVAILLGSHARLQLHQVPLLSQHLRHLFLTLTLSLSVSCYVLRLIQSCAECCYA